MASTTKDAMKQPKDPGPLDWTGKLCGGIRLDIKRRALLYRSDWSDAVSPENAQKTLSTILYLFFACLSPAIAFGTLFDEGTDSSFGVVEMILSSAVSGVLYSTLAGQPLCILGATGPVLAYTVIFYNLCQAMDLEFLPAYFWAGLWFSLFTVLMAVFDICALMKHVTKFTEEIFAGLISLIFIIEAIKPIIAGFVGEKKKSFDVALLQLVLMTCTYGLARRLAALKRDTWFNSTVRTVLSNFAVTIAILLVSSAAAGYRHIAVDMLHVPSTFRPTWTFPGTGEARTWFVKPFGLHKEFPTWGIFFMFFPALGFAVLGFLDQNLTTLLVNRPSNGLKKSPAYHLDLVVCGALVYPICSVLGLPFPVAATVRSLTHLISLTNYEIQDIPGGGTRKVPTSVVEQRVTNLGIHSLIGLSLVFAPLLKVLPKSVLYGVFLFMGISSLNGNELFERLALWFIWDPAKYPQYTFVKNVPLKRLHLFTFLQALCLAILYALKAIKQVAVVFPFFIVALVFIRKSFSNVFSEEELNFLDGEEIDIVGHTTLCKTRSMEEILDAGNRANIGDDNKAETAGKEQIEV